MGNTCWCFEAFRELSKHGFSVVVRFAGDKPNGLGLTCAGCNTRYVLVPVAKPQAVAA